MGFESCHPAVNFIFFSGVLYASATFTHPIFLAIGYLSAFAYSVKRNGSKCVCFHLCLLPLAILFACYYASYHHFGVTVLKQNFIGNNMTLESFLYGCVCGLRIATVCMWVSCVFSVVTADKIVYLFGRISPLFSLGLTVLLRFLPRIKEEAKRINLAQEGIGRGIRQGNFGQRILNGLRIFSMLISRMIQVSASESDSMRSRGSLLRGRTAFSIYRFDNRDRVFVIALFACMTLTAMGVIVGATEMYYNPRIILKTPDSISVFAAFGYALFSLLPMSLEHWTQMKFRKAAKKRFG